MIPGAEAELGRRVNELLTRERLLGPGGQVTTFSTPRRLAVNVSEVSLAQADAQEQLVGPSWKIGVPQRRTWSCRAGVCEKGWSRSLGPDQDRKC